MSANNSFVEDLKKLKHTSLQKLCKQSGLKANGKTADLIQRLTDKNQDEPIFPICPHCGEGDKVVKCSYKKFEYCCVRAGCKRNRPNYPFNVQKCPKCKTSTDVIRVHQNGFEWICNNPVCLHHLFNSNLEDDLFYSVDHSSSVLPKLSEDGPISSPFTGSDPEQPEEDDFHSNSRVLPRHLSEGSPISPLASSGIKQLKKSEDDLFDSVDYSYSRALPRHLPEGSPTSSPLAGSGVEQLDHSYSRVLPPNSYNGSNSNSNSDSDSDKTEEMTRKDYAVIKERNNKKIRDLLGTLQEQKETIAALKNANSNLEKRLPVLIERITRHELENANQN